MTEPHPDAWYAEVAALVTEMRKAGATEAAIAARLQTSVCTMRHLVRKARARGYAIPSVRSLRSPVWQQAAEMALQGATTQDIATRMRVPMKRVSRWLSYARVYGGMEVPYTLGARDAARVLRNMQQKGALPGFGHLGVALEKEPPAFGEWLVQQFGPGDADISHTLIRLVKENIHEPR